MDEAAVNEDDTFRVLKRLPFDQLLKLIINYPLDEHNETVNNIVVAHGWSLSEFFYEYDTRWAA